MSKLHIDGCFDNCSCEQMSSVLVSALFWKHMQSSLNFFLQEEGVCTAEEITLPEKEWSEYLNKQYEAIDSHPAKVLHLLQVIVI